jgi:heme-degrading monooxygenase HmoA
MKTFEDLKSEIEALPHREYIKLVHWLSERDWDAWDHEIESDSAAGKLDFLIGEAAEEQGKGKLGSL